MQYIGIECSGTIVMTSFVFETVRKYQKDSYTNVSLHAKNHRDTWDVFCQTPEADKKIANESFTPGDFLEMFDHKINKVLYNINQFMIFCQFRFNKSLKKIFLQNF